MYTFFYDLVHLICHRIIMTNPHSGLSNGNTSNTYFKILSHVRIQSILAVFSSRSYLHAIYSCQSSLSAYKTRFIPLRIELLVVAGFTVPYKPTYIIPFFFELKLVVAVSIQNEKKALKVKIRQQTKHGHCSPLSRLNSHFIFYFVASAFRAPVKCTCVININ